LIKLLVLDLDGTMLRPDGSVAEEDAREVRLVHDAGTQVAVATGRVRQSFQYVVDAIGFEPYVICANGSYVSAPGQPPLVDMTLPPEVVAPMLREIAKRGVYAHIFTGDALPICSTRETGRPRSRTTCRRCARSSSSPRNRYG
jgi:hydroxymethylpyrimidine pyrophosphatase-like HAD family hydrolase